MNPPEIKKLKDFQYPVGLIAKDNPLHYDWDAMAEWCKENIGTKWCFFHTMNYYEYIFYFSNFEDSIHFKMVWG